VSAQRGLILKALEDRNWGLRELRDATAELREDGRGYTIGTLSAYFNNPSHEIRTRTLYQIGQALGIPLRQLLAADGIDVDAGQPTSGAHARREQVRLILENAAEGDLKRIERVLKLNADELDALDVYLDVLDAQRKQR
jgi:hypothetical protein